jgi:hypothetical protein
VISSESAELGMWLPKVGIIFCHAKKKATAAGII